MMARMGIARFMLDMSARRVGKSSRAYSAAARASALPALAATRQPNSAAPARMAEAT